MVLPLLPNPPTVRVRDVELEEGSSPSLRVRYVETPWEHGDDVPTSDPVVLRAAVWTQALWEAHAIGRFGNRLRRVVTRDEDSYGTRCDVALVYSADGRVLEDSLGDRDLMFQPGGLLVTPRRSEAL